MSISSPLWGIDVSHWQGSVNWPQVRREGFTWAMAKATEGSSYTDSQYRHNVDSMRAAGIIPGAYHFLHHNDTSAQLANFLRAIGPDISKGLIVAVDVEKASPSSASPDVHDVWNFVLGLHPHINRSVIIYSGAWYWKGYLHDPDLSSLVTSCGARIWNSHYVSGTGYASVLYQEVPSSWWTSAAWGGEKPTFLQFTDKAKVAGISVDADAYPGDINSLRAYAGMGRVISPPEEVAQSA